MKRLLTIFGIDLRKAKRSIRGLLPYYADLKKIKAQSKTASIVFPLGKRYPCLEDRYDNSGSANGHYFHQDLLVARRLFTNNPQVHVDVGSRIDGFVAHIASFRKIEVIDIRPLQNNVPNIVFKQIDFMEPLNKSLFEYCDSLSCLHAVEHFGLGRYGDPVNYNGYKLGLDNLYRMLKKDGKLYFSVPIGPQRIEFNAHRVFSVEFLLSCFNGKYSVDQFSYVDDKGDLHENATLSTNNISSNFGCSYGCGIFEMTKL